MVGVDEEAVHEQHALLGCRIAEGLVADLLATPRPELIGSALGIRARYRQRPRKLEAAGRQEKRDSHCSRQFLETQ